MEDGAPLWVVERGRPVTGSQDERAEDADRHRLQPESVEVKDVNKNRNFRYSNKPPANGFDGTFYEGRHANDAQSTARHNKNLDKLTFSLEVLRDHD